jgi:hypothetical protein
MEQALTQDTNLISSCYTILSAVTKTYGNVTSQKEIPPQRPLYNFPNNFYKNSLSPLKIHFQKPKKSMFFSLTTKEK